MFSHGHNIAMHILSTGKPLALWESIRPTAHCEKLWKKRNFEKRAEGLDCQRKSVGKT
jgi:hypothetical protein